MQYDHGRTISILGVSLWFASSILTIIAPSIVAPPVTWYAVALALLLFAFGHGARRFGCRTTAWLFAITVLIVNLYESCSIVTGFPFGSYEHQPQMGLKLFLVPIVIGPVFFGISYMAWTLCETILGVPSRPRDRTRMFGFPIMSALIVTAFDLCIDPISATISQGWIYPHGGGYFGTPLSNYAGWFLVTWSIFQSFALFISRTEDKARALSHAYWYENAIFWAILGFQYPLILMLSGTSVIVHDAGGWAWRSQDILENAAIVSVYTMVATALMACLALRMRMKVTQADAR